MMERIEDGARPPERRLVAPRLIVRASTRPLLAARNPSDP